jgi:hypothetical protein
MSRSRYPSVLALVALAPLLAACGSSNTNSSNGAGASASAGPGKAVSASTGIAFARCVRSHGVPNFPDPTGGSGGGVQIQASQRAGSGGTMTVNGVPVSAPAFQSAMQKCQSYMPHGGKLPPGGIASIRAKSLKFASCMRSHGVPNFPDPQIQSGPGGGVGVRIGGPGSNINPGSPAFKTAQQDCGSLFGGAGLKGGPAPAP